MKLNTILKNKIFLNFSVSLIFFLTAIIVTNFSKTNNNSELVKNFENTLHQKEKKLNNIIEDVRKNAEDGFQKQTLDSYYINNLFDDEGILILVYKNDSLKYWSNNSVPVESIYNKNIYEKKFNYFQNGFFVVENKKIEQYNIVGLILIKNDYPYQNDYLLNKFQDDFNVPDNAKISLNKGTLNIFSLSKDFLFSIDLDKTSPTKQNHIFLIFILYLLGFLFFISFFYSSYKKINPFPEKKLFFVISFSFDILLIRFIMYYFKIPNILYESDLFSTTFYATSQILSSLGDLLINSILILIIICVVCKDLNLTHPNKSKNPVVKYFTIFTLLFHVFIFFVISERVIRGLVLNSNISLNLSNILEISIYSAIGYFIIASILFSFFLISVKLFERVFALCSGFKQYLFLSIFITAIYAVYTYYFKDFNLFYLIFIFVFLISLWVFKKRFNTLFSFSSIIFYLLFFSLLSTYILEKYNNYKEKEERQLLAINLAREQDPIAEYLFQNIEKQIYADKIISALIQKDIVNDNEVIDNILKYFSNKYWNKYKFMITICSENDSLIIKPNNVKTNCYQFFNTIIHDVGKYSFSKNMFYLDNNSWENNYIAILKFKKNINAHQIPFNVFIEINSKYIPNALGYPELLIDKSINTSKNLNKYSYARFNKGDLIYNYGKYLYSLNLSNYGEFNDSLVFFDKRSYNHLFYKIDNENELIISKKKVNYFDIIAPFSYLFIFFAIFILIIYLILHFPFKIKKLEFNFKYRLQLLITLIILVSFLFIGIFTFYYIYNLNNNKNYDNLSEKSHSVLIEVEHKLSNIEAFTPDIVEYLKEILIKFSNVFFSDINLYDLNGNLLASSRPEIFEEKLISDKMNAIAFNQLTVNEKMLFIHREKIGNLKYLSAYVPFRNNQNKIVAYLNLPYFAKENELINEISAFLVAFINIYVIIIVIAIFMILLIANYVSRPLILIKDKIREINLSKINEKIYWKSKDEIGDLINEYNRMIDELENSAELLARSERESAWREMAKQVAHEIKNPLTPMKLSVQYLEKAWNDNAPDWEQRLEKFSHTIVEQIDSLSAIATEFSDFAKMPQSKDEKIELITKIYNSVELYKDFDNIKINIDPKSQGPYYVKADKKQLIRVFNNLIKNSRQAIGDFKKGKIDIGINAEDDNYIISFKDNGVGIPKDKQDNIFSPNFTTKTSGMGLGLAMVKNIINNARGKIWFESKEGTGTTFFISLPKYD